MAATLTPIDPFDDSQVDAWWEAYASAERADRGADAVVWTREESRSELQQASATFDRRAYLLHLGDEVVGSASLGLPLKDNTHVAHIGISVPSQHRRKGVGSQALVLLEAEVLTVGRTTVQATTSWPYELGQGGEGAPGREFARHHHYALALGDVQSRLRLPVAPKLLDLIDEDIADAVAGYELHSWTGPIPDALVERWAVLDASLETEAPTGDLEIEAHKPDVEGIRENEALLVAQRRVSFGTIALAPNGDGAAYSQIVVSTDDRNAYQWGTLVRALDRGHRLGMAVKVANLRLLQIESPDTPAVYTYNAESNTHMRAVNAALGFEPSERMGELQKRLS
jgi:hypothetical protein